VPRAEIEPTPLLHSCQQHLLKHTLQLYQLMRRPSDETLNRGPVCVRIQNIKQAL
jgi:hypothetical protein